MSNIPPLLLERLKKRGIVANASSQNSTQSRPVSKSGSATVPTDTHAEEVFAESYDSLHEVENARKSDQREAGRSSQKAKFSEDPKSDRTEFGSVAETSVINRVVPDLTAATDDSYFLFEEADCPNVSNPYHECVDYCKQHWGLKRFRPSPEMLRKRSRLLKCYPLPAGWYEVADASANRFYYVNLETSQVCWLPPSHPQAHLTFSAKRRAPPTVGAHAVIERAKISYRAAPDADNDTDSSTVTRRSETSDKNEPQFSTDHDESENDSDENSSSNSDSESSNTETTPTKKSRLVERERDASRSQSSAASRRRQIPEGGRARNQKDPMDPSSYSDCPAGTWSDGLEFGGGSSGGGGSGSVRKKSAADSTASGSLYEMRPLPTPGAILRMNAEQAAKKHGKAHGSKSKRSK